MTKISVIVPVYNPGVFFNKCVDSIISQTFIDIEIILVDDGSYDGSQILCDQYQRKDNRIKVFHIKNSGASYARNVGLEHATGEWVMFVDSDDWIEKNTLEIAYKIANEKKSEILQWGCCFDDENKGTYKKRNFSESYFNIIDNYEYFEPSMCYKMIKRKLIEDNFIRYPVGIKLSEDRYFSLMCYLCSSSNYAIENTFYHYQLNLNSATHNITISHIKDEESIIKDFERNVQKLGKEKVWFNVIEEQKILTKKHCIFLLKPVNFSLFRSIFPETNMKIIHSKFSSFLFYGMILLHCDRLAMYLVTKKNNL